MENGILPLPSFIRASATDAATMSMQRRGGTKWDVDDWNTMVAVQDRLIAACYGPLPEGYIRFSVAEQLERAGNLHHRMSGPEFSATIDAVAGPRAA